MPLGTCKAGARQSLVDARALDRSTTPHRVEEPDGGAVGGDGEVGGRCARPHKAHVRDLVIVAHQLPRQRQPGAVALSLFRSTRQPLDFACPEEDHNTSPSSALCTAHSMAWHLPVTQQTFSSRLSRAACLFQLCGSCVSQTQLRTGAMHLRMDVALLGQRDLSLTWGCNTRKRQSPVAAMRPPPSGSAASQVTSFPGSTSPAPGCSYTQRPALGELWMLIGITQCDGLCACHVVLTSWQLCWIQATRPFRLQHETF